MAQAIHNISRLDEPLLELLQHEREQALSNREWKFRLAGYGYAIKEVGDRQIVTKLPHGTELGAVPAHMI